MEFTIHHQVLTAVFVTAVVMGAVANKTNFCTMGSPSPTGSTWATPGACAPGCWPWPWPSSASPP
jgi:hypothetical protein